jgi:hypothetical protein
MPVIWSLLGEKWTYRGEFEILISPRIFCATTKYEISGRPPRFPEFKSRATLYLGAFNWRLIGPLVRTARLLWRQRACRRNAEHVCILICGLKAVRFTKFLLCM